MPDWSYGTVFRPLLFRLPFPFARDFCLGFMGRLASLPLGGAVIDFLGHMRPDPRLRQPSTSATLRPAASSTSGNQVSEKTMSGYSLRPSRRLDATRARV